jgi:hypothetical protein
MAPVPGRTDMSIEQSAVHDPEPLPRERRPWGLFSGILGGLGAALLDNYFKGAFNTDSEILTAILGAGVGLLAVIIAVITLLFALRTDSYRAVIAKIGIKDFMKPFNQVAITAAVTVVASIMALLLSPSQTTPKGTGPHWLQVTFFWVTVWYFVWTIAATIILIYILRGHLEAAGKMEEIQGTVDRAQYAARLAQLERVLGAIEARDEHGQGSGSNPSG